MRQPLELAGDPASRTESDALLVADRRLRAGPLGLLKGGDEHVGGRGVGPEVQRQGTGNGVDLVDEHVGAVGEEVDAEDAWSPRVSVATRAALEEEVVGADVVL